MTRLARWDNQIGCCQSNFEPGSVGVKAAGGQVDHTGYFGFADEVFPPAGWSGVGEDGERSKFGQVDPAQRDHLPLRVDAQSRRSSNATVES